MNKVYQPTEDEEQAAVFQWAEYQQGHYPELALLFHIPNGGYRHPATAAKMKAIGVKPGVPDIFLPVPRKGYHGLWIEMKRRKGGRLSEEQRAWLGAMFQQGYMAVKAAGADEAIAAIVEYLGRKK